MNDFFFCIAVVMLMFLFMGEPDVFDKVQDKAMIYLEDECK